MHVTTATFLAGGAGKSPDLYPDWNLSLASVNSATLRVVVAVDIAEALVELRGADLALRDACFTQSLPGSEQSHWRDWRAALAPARKQRWLTDATNARRSITDTCNASTFAVAYAIGACCEVGTGAAQNLISFQTVPVILNACIVRGTICCSSKNSEAGNIRKNFEADDIQNGFKTSLRCRIMAAIHTRRTDELGSDVST